MILSGNTLEVLLFGRRGAVLSTLRLPGGQPIRNVRVGPPPPGGPVALSPDGRLEFVGNSGPSGAGVSSGPMTILSAASGQVIRRLGSGAVNGQPVFSPDGSRLLLLLGGSQTGPSHAEVMTIATGRTVTLPGASPCGPAPSRFAFSRDGRRVAEETFCGIANVWDAASGRLVRQVNQGAEASSVALNPDGSRLLVSSWDSRATIWNVATGRRLVNLIGHTRGIIDAAMTLDGSLVATSSLDHTVRVWDARTGRELRVLSFTDNQSPLAFSPDGSRLMIADNTPVLGVPGVVRVFDTCPACQSPSALLKLAAPHATTNLTQLESTVVAGS
jgi:WD40 repeat protein